MKEILPGIHAWSVLNKDRGIDFNGHMVVNDEGCVLVDPVPMSAADLKQAEALGRPSAIIITNRHHTRDAGTFAARWKIPILLHEADAQEIPDSVRLGGVYHEGDRLAAGLLVVTLAGQKSPGESALHCRKAKAMILGDALIGKPAGSLNLLPPDKYKDLAAARKGLSRLLDFSYEAVLVGDGASLPTGGRKAVEEFLL